MESDLQTLLVWFNSNKLTMHIDKTKFIIFHQKNTVTHHLFNTITLNDHTITRVDTYKFLGIHLDSALNFTLHVDHVKKKILPYIRILGGVKHYLPTPELKKIYFAYIQCHINYLLPIYSAAPLTKLNELYILQKKAIKHVYKLRPDHPSESLFKENILSLFNLSKSESCILFYKIKNRLIKMEDTFPTRKDISKINTRQQHLFHYNNTNKEYIKRSFFYSCPIKYNSLPDPVKASNNLATFKKNIHDFITTADSP